MTPYIIFNSARKYLFGFTVLSATAAAVQNIAVWLRIKSGTGHTNEDVYANLLNVPWALGNVTVGWVPMFSNVEQGA